MVDRVVKTPGPDHPITSAANLRRVVIKAGGVAIADTTCALTLKEASYPPVFYIPREDAWMDLLRGSKLRSYCLCKDEASYFSTSVGGDKSVDAVWSYEKPYASVALVASTFAHGGFSTLCTQNRHHR
jgi:uncharacterized protein (DUF427 family)